MTTSEQSLLRQYSDIPFPHVPGRILLVFVNRGVAQAESDRRYVVQAAVALTNGAKSKADYLSLAQAVFPDLGQQSRDKISFLLPKIPSTSTELHFDESTTWYRLADEMFLHLEGTTVLGVQCSALFRKPQKRAIDKLVDEVSGSLLLIIGAVIFIAIMAVNKK